MASYDAFKQAQAARRVQDPCDGCYFTHGKREARRRARRVLKAELRSWGR